MSTTISEREQWVGDRRNPLVFKLDGQALLINGLQKSAAFLVVHFEAGANDRVTLALVNDFSHLIRVNSRDSRAPEKLLAFLSVYAVQFCVQP